MNLENLPFAALFETVLRETYADATITGISVVVNRSKQANVYHAGDMDNLSLMAAGYRAAVTEMHEQLEELRHGIEGDEDHDDE